MDTPRHGVPKSDATPEIFQKVLDFLLPEKREKLRELADAAGISTK